ncbi:hypothetical protein BLNAU_8018 [Blattamonas nauphoetae]|uniref:Uncharacterized protein n=1 Tax=Blattamonas nauphoetae TaxID=2049346 RepID=A0ABQ9XZK9_9EUKA|nr:hypothetical protein BLNAU_8018 [Blattamonas nauphoetae]
MKDSLSSTHCSQRRTTHFTKNAFVSSHLVQVLINSDFVFLLKSTIIACLDLLDHERSESNCPNSDQTNLLIKILERSWGSAADSLFYSRELLHPIVESAFSDVPQLCSLLERTFCRISPTVTSHLGMIINISASLPRLVSRLLEENLVERVIDASKPMAVSTKHGGFHLNLIWAINNIMCDPRNIAKDEEERKRIRMLQFERVLQPAKQYLEFVLPREEFFPNEVSSNNQLPSRISLLLARTLVLERDLSEDSEIVETGREEWEVGWLVEKTKEKELGERLEKIRQDDVRMKKKEKSRWKKRVERQREAGHEDAMEGWLTRMDLRTRPEIVDYLRHVSEKSGMNVRL